MKKIILISLITLLASFLTAIYLKGFWNNKEENIIDENKIINVDQGNLTDAQENLFNNLDKLIALKPLTVDTMESILNIRLMPDPDISNEYFKFFKASQTNNLVTQVDLRIPQDKTKDGFIAIDVNPKLKIELAEILKRFGNNPKLNLNPDAPKNMVAYYQYILPDAKLSFGFNQSFLEKIIVDRIPD